MSDRTGRRQQRTGNQEDEMIDERQRTRQPRLCYLETAVALSADRPKTSGPAQSKIRVFRRGMRCDFPSDLLQSTFGLDLCLSLSAPLHGCYAHHDL